MPAYSGMWTLSQVAQAIKNNDWTGVPPTVVEYLIVAGGGGGGSIGGGGGGAGGLLAGYAGIAVSTSYFVTVGSGGAGSTLIANRGVNGNASVFDAASSGASTGRIVAIGGGGGGSSTGSGVNSGAAGGSGGGANYDSGAGGSGTSGQGNAGAGVSSGSPNYYCGSGGGGAGTVGFPENTMIGSGIGGAGIGSAITGATTTYGGGGGGGGNNGQNGCVGGVGGGGTGGKDSNSVNATVGTANTGGGGGGGGGGFPNFGTGASGGSGIVVIRYPGSVQYFTGGTLNYSNGYIVHTFYSSGTLVPVAPRLFASPDYQIARSLRFNSANSTYLTRTWGSNGSQTTATFSVWVKRTGLGVEGRIFGDSTGSGSIFWLFFNSSDQLQVYTNGTAVGLTTTQVFRDPSAWYHIVVVINTTQQTSTDRIKLYVNGNQITAFTGTQTYYSQFEAVKFNNTTYTSYIGWSTSASINGYMTEINWIDGQALTPSNFGYTEPTTGVWTPLKFTGSYGTNGFYLTFADNSNTTAATLGADSSGNGNNWTPNNFSVAAGSGNSSLLDTPTNYGVDTGVGGEVRGNYATINPLDNYNTNAATAFTFANGNLDVTRAAQSWASSRSTMAMTSGKWYAEMTVTASTAGTLNAMFGVCKPDFTINDYFSGQAGGYGYNAANGQKYNNGTGSAYGATFTTNDVIGIAYDADAGSLVFYKNGVSQGTAYTGLTGTYCFAIGLFPQTSGSITATLNCGQRPFAYTAPTGYKALCTQNLPESAVGRLPNKYFGIATYQGTGAYNVIPTGIDAATNGGLVWLQSRTYATQHDFIDSVRGYTKLLDLPSTGAESTYNANIAATNFGYTINDNSNQLNGSAYTYVGWNWAGGGTAVTNTAGSITSQVSANPVAGFSIVTYTGAGGAGNSVGHGLAAVPQMIILKQRTAQTNYNWFVYHQALGNTQYLLLNSLNPATSGVSAWNNTTPTSSVFTIGSYAEVNNTGSTFVAYCWAEVAGYSKFGSYAGNGAADGTFVYCGFRPRWIMVKLSNGSDHWEIIDTARDTYNIAGLELYANLTNAESTGGGNISRVDLLSNGFKARTTNGGWNGSGSTYIFAAFAESPLKYARVR